SPSHRGRDGRASLPAVDRTAYAVLTFDVPPKHSAPLTRGFFLRQCGHGQTYVQAAISRECSGAHKALPISALKSAAAHNDVNFGIRRRTWDPEYRGSHSSSGWPLRWR